MNKMPKNIYVVFVFLIDLLPLLFSMIIYCGLIFLMSNNYFVFGRVDQGAMSIGYFFPTRTHTIFSLLNMNWKLLLNGRLIFFDHHSSFDLEMQNHAKCFFFFSFDTYSSLLRFVYSILTCITEKSSVDD